LDFQYPAQNIVIIGSSAGGPRVLKIIFSQMPVINGCFIIVQHMPKYINESFRENMQSWTDMEVLLARDKISLMTGKIYIAPSEYQLNLVNNRTLHIFEGEKQHYVSPSVDVIMKSTVKTPTHKLFGIILTGMGCDGAEGIAHIKDIGGTTIAQDEETSVIFGMPREAINTGKVDYILSPDEIRDNLIEMLGFLK